MTRQLSAWFPVALATLFIFSLSSQPYTTLFKDVPEASQYLFQRYLQYPAHLVVYGALTLLWIRALRSHPLTMPGVRRTALVSVLVTAVLEELVQFYTPTRTFALRDLLMDGAGGALAVAVSHRIFPVNSRKS